MIFSDMKAVHVSLHKQVAFGDEGLSYNFSNNEVPARPWLPFLEAIRDTITEVSGHKFNFVLINRRVKCTSMFSFSNEIANDVHSSISFLHHCNQVNSNYIKYRNVQDISRKIFQRTVVYG